MSAYDRLETSRLVLRRWREADRDAFAAMNADPVVMEHFPALLDRRASDAFLDELERRWDANGVGLWVLERRTDAAFLGYAGLNPMPDGTPGAGEWEVGWRLVRTAWGHGYASEGGREAMRVALDELGLARVWSLTAVTNVRSQAVMRRLGLVEHSRFDLDRPTLPPGHPLRPHVVYVSPPGRESVTDLRA